MAKTPTLEKICTDLTELARQGKLPPVVGRDAEIERMIEILCIEHGKANVALLGPAGTGKTALVEGLAQRIVRNEVPEKLKGCRIFSLSISSLTSNKYCEFGDKVNKIIEEASQHGIIIFIDEAHMLRTAGYEQETLVNLFKNPISRGEMKLIIATTEDEYTTVLQNDEAFTRRFEVVHVSELSPDIVKYILEARMQKTSNVLLEEDLISYIVEVSQRLIRHRHFPDKAIDIFDRAISHAKYTGRNIVDKSFVDRIVYQTIGLPDDWRERLDSLELNLREKTILPRHAITCVVNRLRMVLHGFSLQHGRPWYVLLILSPRGDDDGGLSQVLARNFLNDEKSLLTDDGLNYQDLYDIRNFLGSARGLIGYDQPLIIHKFITRPTRVFLFRSIDQAHPRLQDILASGFEQGYFIDSRGKQIPISNGIFVLTATLPDDKELGVVFETQDIHSILKKIITPSLAQNIDYVIPLNDFNAQKVTTWVQQTILAEIKKIYENRGLFLQWSDSFIQWLHRKASDFGFDSLAWRRYLENEVLVKIFARPEFISSQATTSLKYLVDHDGVDVKIKTLDATIERYHDEEKKQTISHGKENTFVV